MERTDLPVAILFGREDVGLFNTELELCDIAVTIPTHPDNHVLNISHALIVILYELYSSGIDDEFLMATPSDKDRLSEEFDELLSVIRYPEHRKEHTSTMFKRLI